jgi:hypothetical protein
MERCFREIAAIEAELRAGNRDVAGLLFAYADWHAELRILQVEQSEHDEGTAANREIGGGDLAA